MRIVVCEDNKVHQHTVRQLISKILFDKEDVNIRCFDSGEGLLEAIKNESGFYADIIFLDIKMPKLDGIQTAKYLLEQKINTAVVFLTAHSEYVFQGYELHAYDYLLKPVTERKLEKVLLRFIEEREGQEDKYLIISRRTGKRKILLEKVLYFVSDKRKITAVMEEPQSNITFYMTMQELKEKLRNRKFFRCHQSFMVNITKVTEWDSTSAKIEDGSWIPISKRYRGALDQLWEEQQIQ